MKNTTYSLVMAVLFINMVRSHDNDVTAPPTVTAKSGREKVLSFFLQDHAPVSSTSRRAKNWTYPASSRRNSRQNSPTSTTNRGHRTSGAALLFAKKKFLLKLFFLAKLFIYGTIAKAKIGLIMFKVLLFVALKFLTLAVIHTAMAVVRFYFQYQEHKKYHKDDVRNQPQQTYGRWYGGRGQDSGGGYHNGDQGYGGWYGGRGQDSMGGYQNGDQGYGGWYGGRGQELGGEGGYGGWYGNGGQNNGGWNGGGGLYGGGGTGYMGRQGSMTSYKFRQW